MKFPHPHFSRLFLLLGLAAISSSSAYSQTSTVNLKFVSFPKAADAGPILLLIGEDATMEVELPTNSISKAYKVPALSTWALGKTSTTEEGKFAFEAYGKTQSAGGTDQLILVVRKGPNAADGLELTAMKNNDQGFSGGKYFLMNASKADIAGTLGTSKFALKPGTHDLIAPKPTKTAGSRKYAYVKIFFRKGEEVQPFFSATWRFNEEARSMVFFYHDPNTGQLRLHTIRSFL